MSGFNCCTCIFSLCWGMQDFWWQCASSYLWPAGPSALTRDPTWPPALGAWSLSHWTTREVHACLISNVGPRGDYNNSLLLLRDPGWQRNHHKLPALGFAVGREEQVADRLTLKLFHPEATHAPSAHISSFKPRHVTMSKFTRCGLRKRRELKTPVGPSDDVYTVRVWVNERMSSVHKDQEMGPGKQARLGSQFLPLLWTWVPCNPVGPASIVKWLGLIMPLTCSEKERNGNEYLLSFHFLPGRCI